jgi:hypothetical protein
LLSVGQTITSFPDSRLLQRQKRVRFSLVLSGARYLGFYFLVFILSQAARHSEHSSGGSWDQISQDSANESASQIIFFICFDREDVVKISKNRQIPARGICRLRYLLLRKNVQAMITHHLTKSLYTEPKLWYVLNM